MTSLYTMLGIDDALLVRLRSCGSCEAKPLSFRLMIDAAMHKVLHI